MMRRKPLAALLLSLVSSAALAIEPFTIKDIRVEGIQRTDAGTVFNYLPVKVGDRIDDAKAAEAIKALYGTGFFRDVRIEGTDGVLIVSVLERPTIAQIEIAGAKEFDKDTLKKALKDIGLAESRIFDRSMLEKADQELRRQYISRGRYSAEVTTTVTPLERNRVAVNFAISEGEVARIAQINIVGAKVYREKDLVDEMQLTTPGWMTWYTKNDQYSKQKLGADLEALRSYYTNRGYLDFNIESTQVQITPDKREIFITVNVTEGEKYTVSNVRIAGELLVPEEELRKLILLQPGAVFSRAKLTETNKAIADRLGNDGYAFANVNAVPEVDKEKRQVAFTFLIDPGRRIYVRRVNVVGNTRTRDVVVRRELRQLESAWYDGSKIARSKERIDRLGFFNEINIETPSVPGAPDQVDLDLTVTEKPTGNILFGIGYSSGDGLVLSGSISQNNVFGSGNALAAQVNSSKVNRVFSVSYTNPYFTPDGVSRGFDLYQRNVDPTSLGVGTYKSSTIGAGVRFGLPLTETDTVNFGLATEQTELTLYLDSPQRYIDFANTFGLMTNSIIGTIGWARDTRDSILYPTRGRYQRLFGEIGFPVSSLAYYKLNYQHQWFTPVFSPFTLMLNGELGIGDGLKGKPLPFFKNFFAGGVGSVRGYDTASMGPRDTNDEFLGGKQRIVGNAELLFPFPGMKQDKSVRGSLFVDGGRIRGDGSQGDLESFRFSTGAAVTWQSPLGLLKFSYAVPLNAKDGDRLQRFQFQFGNVF